MLADDIEVDEVSPVDLRERYERRLAAVIESVGADRAAAATGLDADRIEAIAAGNAADLPLEDAAAVLALAEDGRTPEDIMAAVRDRLLLGMSSAMLDVDVVANELDADVTPGEVQAMVEGRLSMTLDEYARLRHFIASGAQSGG